MAEAGAVPGAGRRRAARLAPGAFAGRRRGLTTRTVLRSPFFRSIGDEINQALDPVVTALTGVTARVADRRRGCARGATEAANAGGRTSKRPGRGGLTKVANGTAGTPWGVAPMRASLSKPSRSDF